MLSFRSLRRPVSLTGERPCSWSWIQRSSLRRWPSRWRSGTGTWWERMTSWERFGCLDCENDNNAILIRHYVCRTIDFQSYDTEFYALISSFFPFCRWKSLLPVCIKRLSWRAGSVCCPWETMRSTRGGNFGCPCYSAWRVRANICFGDNLRPK